MFMGYAQESAFFFLVGGHDGDTTLNTTQTHRPVRRRHDELTIEVMVGARCRRGLVFGLALSLDRRQRSAQHRRATTPLASRAARVARGRRSRRRR